MAVSIKRVGVAGSGIMGSGIAQVAAQAGFEVVLRSRSQENADATVDRLAKSLGKLVEKDKLSADERDTILSNISATSELDELAACDLVIESIVEDLDVKKDFFRELDEACPDGAILATNTSTLPVGELANATKRPERVCGLHFFNPAPQMALVEVVPASATSQETVDALRTFAEECGKTPVTAKDSAGFIVNALLFPYLNGAVRLLEAGVASKEDIDTAMKEGCGFPMGPFQLLDLIGLDTSLAILERLHDESGEPCTAPAGQLRALVSDGHIGRKSGQGFYSYEDAKEDKERSG